jgi:hypothetical protein
MELAFPSNSFKSPHNNIFHLMSLNNFTFLKIDRRFEDILFNKNYLFYKITKLAFSLIIRILLRFSSRSKSRH